MLCDVAQVSDTVTSQVRHLPHDQGNSVTPSGLLPSSIVRPSGSFLEGMLALPSARHTISLIILCRCCLPARFLQTRPWSPLALTLSPRARSSALLADSCKVVHALFVQQHQTPPDSKATATKAWVFVMVEYFILFDTAALSSASPALIDVWARWDMA